MLYLITLMSISLLFLILHLVNRERRRKLEARRHGCQAPTVFPSLEPLFGFDFMMAIHMDVPSFHRYLQRYGRTFLVRSFISQPVIATTESENIETILRSAKDWGVAPLRQPKMEYFCGRGFLIVDGKIWHDSRKLLKPTFDRRNLVDLSILAGEVDRFLARVSNDDGSTVDLQPLIFQVVCRSYPIPLRCKSLTTHSSS
jgi:cytochrome P450